MPQEAAPSFSEDLTALCTSGSPPVKGGGPCPLLHACCAGGAMTLAKHPEILRPMALLKHDAFSITFLSYVRASAALATGAR